MNPMAYFVFAASALGTAALLVTYCGHRKICLSRGRKPKPFPWPPIAAFAVIDAALVLCMVKGWA